MTRLAKARHARTRPHAEPPSRAATNAGQACTPFCDDHHEGPGAEQQRQRARQRHPHAAPCDGGGERCAMEAAHADGASAARHHEAHAQEQDLEHQGQQQQQQQQQQQHANGEAPKAAAEEEDCKEQQQQGHGDEEQEQANGRMQRPVTPFQACICREPSLGSEPSLSAAAAPGTQPLPLPPSPAARCGSAAAAEAAAAAVRRLASSASWDEWHCFLQDCALEPVVAPTPLPACVIAASHSGGWRAADAAGTAAAVELAPPAAPLPLRRLRQRSASSSRSPSGSPPPPLSRGRGRGSAAAAAGGGRRRSSASALVAWLARALELVFPRGTRWLVLLAAAVVWGVAKQLWRSGARRDLRALARFMRVLASGI